MANVNTNPVILPVVDANPPVGQSNNNLIWFLIAIIVILLLV